MDLLGIIAHFIDEDWKHQNTLLALSPTRGSHTGENMSEQLLHVINDYQLGNNIEFYAADNAYNNDTAIRLLGDLDVNLHKQRLRCAAHIINLVCKAILVGVDVDCLQDACNNANALAEDEDTVDKAITTFRATVRDDKAALAAWHRKGPVGKLHNLVLHVKSSPARRHLFENKQKEVDPELPVYKLVVNGGIRWNSTYDMIARALKLKDALELYQYAFRHDADNPIDKDELTPDDWLELRQPTTRSTRCSMAKPLSA
ncbi:hypothetical protein B0A55_10806 [Friedmanniomyces simplex]|uniref:HAT C-terminal dimerisation domain-containing protein n=1 Tax=Friedmanniomyces simplex TaxID=329884 RepID=A0A4U0X3J9_9PEZI|nr:hypothetical protein B0A55_10806 [Friedmanniomyces simplex]